MKRVIQLLIIALAIGSAVQAIVNTYNGRTETILLADGSSGGG